ncbi:phosphatase PAP2 family protein [Flavisolibacter tropicus]|uniref:phosphatase PAP2 family protein n=1 Tax=Flavisolibacter tropicus TaxID=1492898 RepID=UPI0011E04247|nr:phosphatase PAP2 family protein [Flavisolibacter tropicus]
MKQFITCLCFLFASVMAQAQDAAGVTVTQDTVNKQPLIKHIVPKLAIGVAYAATVYTVYKTADPEIQDESQEGKTAFKSDISHSVSPLGLATTNMIGSVLVTGYGMLSKNPRLQKAGVLLMGSLAVNGFVTATLKKQFQRYRPSTGKSFNTFDGDDGPGINQSFPSAHTSNAFTTATIFASIYKDKKWVAPFAYGMATMVGLSRIYDNAHWASDVMTGAAIGFLSAKSVLLLDKVLSNHHIHIYPQIGLKQAGAAMVYQF